MIGKYFPFYMGKYLLNFFIMEEYFKYIKNPILLKQEKIDWYSFFKVLFFSIFISYGFLAAVRFLNFMLGFPKLEETFKFESVWEYILLGVIYAPISEELLFRLPLRMNRLTLGISSLLITVLAISIIVKGEVFYPFLFLVPLLLLLLLSFLKKIPFKYFFYLSALLFGLAHSFNYTGGNFMLPFVIAILIFDGTVLGFIRMKYGIQYSILFHMFVNSLGILAFLH